MEGEGEERAEELKEAKRDRERERGREKLVLTFQFCEAQFDFVRPAVYQHYIGQCRENGAPLVVHAVIWGELEKDAPFLRYFTAICWETVIITM